MLSNWLKKGGPWRILCRSLGVKQHLFAAHRAVDCLTHVLVPAGSSFSSLTPRVCACFNPWQSASFTFCVRTAEVREKKNRLWLLSVLMESAQWSLWTSSSGISCEENSLPETAQLSQLCMSSYKKCCMCVYYNNSNTNTCIYYIFKDINILRKWLDLIINSKLGSAIHLVL